ncbi:trypsin epsilon-like isoform X2 [Hyposmocoma kahamanoa]|nr:trypsin epsilon-like isoform X2 [Hyposmocoma kahamanoa]
MSLDESEMQNPMDNENTNNFLGYVPMLNRKIYKGTRVVILEHPYVVSIRRQYAHFLTGSLLSHYVIITIAQPLFDVPLSELAVICGENYADRGTIMYTVLLFLPYPEFDPYTLHNDLSLLRVYEAITYRPSIRPIGNVMYPTKEIYGFQGFVTGWGRCDLSGKELCLPRASRWFPNEKFDPMLRSITFPLEQKACSSYSQYGLKIRTGMLCVGQARENNPGCPCMAVPGAPLVVGKDLVGLQSWGFGCGYKTDLPIIYTDLRQYYYWLEYNFKYLTVNITSKNLQLLFEATKAHYLLQWLDGTRGKKILMHQHIEHDLHPWELDNKLALVAGEIYDIRDYVEGGAYRIHKQNMYKMIKVNIKFSENLSRSSTTSKAMTETSTSTLWNGILPFESEDYYESRVEEGIHNRQKTILENHVLNNQSEPAILTKMYKEKTK